MFSVYPCTTSLVLDDVKMTPKPLSHTQHYRQRFHPYIRHISHTPRIIEDPFQTSASLYQTREHLMMQKLNEDPFQTSVSPYQTRRIPWMHEEPCQTSAYSQQTTRYQSLPKFNEKPLDKRPYSHQTFRQEGLFKLSEELFQNRESSQELSKSQGNMALVSLLREGQGHCQSTASNNVAPYFTGYTYPTLTFLLPGNSEDTTHGTEYIGKLTKEHNKLTTSSKEKMAVQLHPFHRRQLLTLAPSREGLTRTRDKYRVVYTEKQKKLLEDEYEKDNFISESRRTDLASETGLTERQIKFWFQNRRAKDKRVKTISKDVHNAPNTYESQKPTSKIAVNNTGLVIKDNHQSELPSCKYEKELLAGISASPNSKEDGQTTDLLKETGPSPSFLSGSCMYTRKQSMNQSESHTTGSCRFENTAERSPTSCATRLQKQYPVSPSEWSVTSQHSYLLDRVEMSPLFNGLQPSFDFRM